MKSVQAILATFMAGILALTTVGCTPTSNLVTTLNAVADAASVAVVVAQGLAAAGKISPADAALIATYASGVSTAVTESITELSSSDTNPIKITKISGFFAAVAVPAIPGGSALAPYITAIVQVVTQFIGQLNSSTVLTAAKVAPKAPLKLTMGDKMALHKTKKKADATIAVAAKLKK
jgi:hypothetical protein